MPPKDWNPHAYLTFEKERTRPAIDLAARITIENPARIIDIGCGPGNSTMVLARRFPESELIGVDSSPAMIAKAKNDYPFIDWRIADAGNDTLPGNCDVIFSNATIQWIPDHAALLAKFRSMLTENGILAIQIPQFFDMPVGRAIDRIADDRRWAGRLAEVRRLFTMHNRAEYYDLLAPQFGSVDMWETEYVHVMDSPKAILGMIRSTGLKPYLDCLTSDEDVAAFEKEMLAEIIMAYPLQHNGKVLFPFRRLFFVVKV